MSQLVRRMICKFRLLWLATWSHDTACRTSSVQWLLKRQEVSLCSAKDWKEGKFSKHVAGEIDAEVSASWPKFLKRADTAVKTHRPLLDAIAKRLIEKETIEREEFEIYIGGAWHPAKEKGGGGLD